MSKANTSTKKSSKNTSTESFTLRDLLQAFITDADKNLKLKLVDRLNDKETDLNDICNSFLDKNKTKVKMMFKTEKKTEDEEKKALKEKKKGMPKKNKNAYQYFANDIHPQLVDDGIAAKDIFKATSDAWKDVSSKDKNKYKKMAEKDKERFNKEIEAYYEEHPEEKVIKKGTSGPKKWNALTFWINENLAEYQENNPEMDEKDVKKQMKEEWKDLDKDTQKEWKDKASAKNKNASSSSSSSSSDEEEDEENDKKTKVPKSKSKKSDSDSDSDEKKSSSNKKETEPTLPELKKIAKDLGLKGYSTMKKQELVDAIKAHKWVRNGLYDNQKLLDFLNIFPKKEEGFFSCRFSPVEEEVEEKVEEEAEEDLSKHKIPQLRDIAKALGIDTKNLKKDELIEAIQAKRSGSDEEDEDEEEDEGDEEELEDDE